LAAYHPSAKFKGRMHAHLLVWSRRIRSAGMNRGHGLQVDRGHGLHI
jgi:hypothetical protein